MIAVGDFNVAGLMGKSAVGRTGLPSSLFDEVPSVGLGAASPFVLESWCVYLMNIRSPWLQCLEA